MTAKVLLATFKTSWRHSWALIVYLLAVVLLIPTYGFAKVLVISDIDDTLKVSHVLSSAGSVSSAVDESSRFVGMAEVFQHLKKTHEDIEFHYVSLAPKALMTKRHQAFLQKNAFPVTGLYLNPGLRSDPQLKQKFIRKILKDKEPQLVLYFGDNGQYDVNVYDQMVREFPQIPSVTYIREAYSGLGESEFPTLNSQVGFVTSVELTIDLISRGLLTQEAYLPVETIVYETLALTVGEEAFGPMVFPWWQDCRDFKWRWAVDKPTTRLIAIKKAIDQRCRR